MQAFVQYTPTEIHFGRGAEDMAGTLVKKHGGKKVMVVYGGKSAEKSGLLGRVLTQLGDEGVEALPYGGVQPNPHLSHAREGVRLALRAGVDFILAVGGGSAIDAAKAIAHGVANPETDIWKFWTREADLTKSTPVGVVLTISAAGSETSNSAVITNTETGEKRGLGTDFNRPRFALMNPELTYTLPKLQIACGVVDIMMHTLDRYFTTDPAPGELTDAFAAGLLRTVIKNGVIALDNPSDYDAMSELMWAGSISHNGLTGLGRIQDFSVHQLGHELSGKFDVAHGASLSTVWASWARYCLGACPARFAKLARDVWGIADENDETAANKGIDAAEKYFRSLDMPTGFAELGIGVQGDATLDDLADRCVFRGKREVGIFRPLNKADVRAIYVMANR